MRSLLVTHPQERQFGVVAVTGDPLKKRVLSGMCVVNLVMLAGCGGDRTPRETPAPPAPLEEHVAAVSEAIVTPATGLTGLWHFDGNTADASGHGHTGTLLGTPTVIASGRFGKAYSFDGSSSIDVGDLIPSTSQSYSVNVWFRTTHPAITEDWRMMIGKLDLPDGTAGSGPLNLFLGDGRDVGGSRAPIYQVQLNGGGPFSLGDYSLSSINGHDGAWHMATATYKSGKQALYVDGALLGSATFAGPLPQPHQLGRTVIIGGTEWGAYVHPWIGDLDEVALWNRALTAAEVTALYAPPPGPKSCLAILQSNPDAKDGVYAIQPNANLPAFNVRCDMTADAGGWTLVGNYPYPGNVGVAGWNGGAQVGTSFTDRSKPFKMSDAVLNSIKSSGHGFRAHGKATYCALGGGTFGPCSINTTAFFKSSCSYSSSVLAPNCANAFRDYVFAVPIGTDATACPSGHYGLVASTCGVTSTMITSHAGDLIAVGAYAASIEAHNGRPLENPSIDVWVK